VRAGAPSLSKARWLSQKSCRRVLRPRYYIAPSYLRVKLRGLGVIDASYITIFWAKPLRDLITLVRCYFLDFSTCATNVEAGTPSALPMRRSVSSVGDILSFSRRLIYVRSKSASKANFSCVIPDLSRAFLSTSPNMLRNSHAQHVDCLSLIRYRELLSIN